MQTDVRTSRLFSQLLLTAPGIRRGRWGTSGERSISLGVFTCCPSGAGARPTKPSLLAKIHLAFLFLLSYFLFPYNLSSDI